jgi:AraC family transcriptional regulator of adaptative response/methylated-DNA-[protein]-cysteine methyltransferase
MTVQIQTTTDRSHRDDDRWRAVIRRDPDADGTFVYAVLTTGVYCRPSCAAKRPRRQNVTFHASPAAALRQGFRPCKRCRPNDASLAAAHADVVARACRLIDSSDARPNLASLADAVKMSPSHFRRIFVAETGLTPKAYATAHRARRLRKALPASASVTAAMYETGFNSSGRFYDDAPRALGMTPARFRAGGAGEAIRFAVGQCSLGSILVAASQRGICSIALGDDPAALLRELEDRFPRAQLIGGDKQFDQLIARVVAFVEQPARGLRLPLDVRGTAFQHRVWRKLCEIPPGQARNYGEIACQLGKPRSTRAVARACAANPIAVAIPCHRVVRRDGALGGYRWGIARKGKLLRMEQTMEQTADARPSASPPAAAPPTMPHVVS